jgi:hypothetical protein
MSDELRKVLGIAEDPYVDAPLWEDDEEIERTRGICEICGELTDNVDELRCAEHDG